MFLNTYEKPLHSKKHSHNHAVTALGSRALCGLSFKNHPDSDILFSAWKSSRFLFRNVG